MLVNHLFSSNSQRDCFVFSESRFYHANPSRSDFLVTVIPSRSVVPILEGRTQGGESGGDGMFSEVSVTTLLFMVN